MSQGVQGTDHEAYLKPHSRERDSRHDGHVSVQADLPAKYPVRCALQVAIAAPPAPKQACKAHSTSINRIEEYEATPADQRLCRQVCLHGMTRDLHNKVTVQMAFTKTSKVRNRLSILGCCTSQPGSICWWRPYRSAAKVWTTPIGMELVSLQLLIELPALLLRPVDVSMATPPRIRHDVLVCWGVSAAAVHAGRGPLVLVGMSFAGEPCKVHCFQRQARAPSSGPQQPKVCYVFLLSSFTWRPTCGPWMPPWPHFASAAQLPH